MTGLFLGPWWTEKPSGSQAAPSPIDAVRAAVLRDTTSNFSLCSLFLAFISILIYVGVSMCFLCKMSDFGSWLQLGSLEEWEEGGGEPGLTPDL